MESWLQRYRHTRGYGVHSPFAYRLIREVIGERLPYYDYGHLSTPRQRLLYRLTVAFQPHRIIALGGADIRAAKMAVSSSALRPVAWMCTDSCSMAIASAQAPVRKMVEALTQGRVLIVEGASEALLQQMRAAMTCGMAFYNSRGMLIAVPFAHLPRQDFYLNF